METSEEERLDVWLKSDETSQAQSLHTLIIETGYQPYGDKKAGTVTVSGEYGPVEKQRSRSSGSAGSSRCSRSEPLESGRVALTAPVGPMSGAPKIYKSNCS